jgi:hypothetical protein
VHGFYNTLQACDLTRGREAVGGAGRAEGLDGLRDRRRGGRPATYTPEQVGELIAASLTALQDLGLPFARWTLDRLDGCNVVVPKATTRRCANWFPLPRRQ